MKITGSKDPLSPSRNRSFFFWDEFRARYVSTIILAEYVRDTSSVEDAENVLDVVCGSLFAVKNKFVNTYNGVQFLGAVAACEKTGIYSKVRDICTDDELRLIERYTNVYGVRDVI